VDARVALEHALRAVFPGARVGKVVPIGLDATEGGTEKAVGYGRPLEITLRLANGQEKKVVFRTASSNEFGHDHRSDRAQQMLLAYDTFGQIPGHIEALDVGAIRSDNHLISLAKTGEFYLLTSFAQGTLYADQLRRIGRQGLLPNDLERARILARYLVQLHANKLDDPPAYRRAIRDLVGHGEGIFGMVDGYPEDVPGAPPERLREIERRVLEWRWRLRGRSERLRRTHGDFHPFNVLWDRETDLHVLDASRGCKGDPADDLTAMAINYPFFALQFPGSWESTFGPLWRRFWSEYLEGSRDDEVPEVVAPFLAWRALVLASPRWYPHLPVEARQALLGFVEAALTAPRFDPDSADRLFQ
jgi:hypothetical protein